MSKDDRVFGLIWYKSDDFSENSFSNSEICVVMLSLLVLLTRISREYTVTYTSCLTLNS